LVSCGIVGRHMAQCLSGRSGFIRYGPARARYIAMARPESNTAETWLVSI
jgi:hypothetical protein